MSSQPASSQPAKRTRRTRCGSCAGCQAAPCGACKYCLDHPSRGGAGTLRRACVQTACHQHTAQPPVAATFENTPQVAFAQQQQWEQTMLATPFAQPFAQPFAPMFAPQPLAPQFAPPSAPLSAPPFAPPSAPPSASPPTAAPSTHSAPGGMLAPHAFDAATAEQQRREAALAQQHVAKRATWEVGRRLARHVHKRISPLINREEKSLSHAGAVALVALVAVRGHEFDTRNDASCKNPPL